MMRYACRLLGRKDFDAWAYNIFWPQSKTALPWLNAITLAAEDIKFAYNAWSFLRLAMFYGVGHPKVLSHLEHTKPSMNIACGGNRLFYLNARVGEPLNSRALKIALTPDHPRAVPIQQFPWQEALLGSLKGAAAEGIEIVLGMENGLSDAVADQCDHHVYISQYGSIGSLSMMSAMAIATHIAVCTASSRASSTVGYDAAPVNGHMPRSNHTSMAPSPRPHETDLLHYSNEDIVHVLRERRTHYPLQVSIMIYNALGDRNIGAIMRNANAFNCEEMLIINRRKFNRRGAVGTNHILKTTYVSSLAAQEADHVVDGYEVWLLYQYYPYLLVHPGTSAETEPATDVLKTFIRHNDPRLSEYMSTGHVLTQHHPLTVRHPQLTADRALSLDDAEGLTAALRSIKGRGLKGVMLAVPEEGAVPHAEVADASHRVLYVMRPEHVRGDVQRGLNGALATAIALERIRTCIDSL